MGTGCRSRDHAARKGGWFSSLLPPRTLRCLSRLLEDRRKRYGRRLRRCQKKFSPEAVHESRVETRRLLSLVDLLGAFLPAGRLRKVERALKRHLDTFDELRDSQVQLAELRGLAKQFPAARLFRSYLSKRETRLADTTRRQIRRVKARRLAGLLADCRGKVEAALGNCPPAETARLLAASVDRAFKRTWRLQRRMNPRDTTTIHRTRVAFKKFRYMLETLSDFSPCVTSELLGELHDYQTMMGRIQDSEVLLQAWDRFRSKQRLEPANMRPFQLELVRRRRELIRNYLKVAARLETFWPLPEQRRTS